MDGWDRCHAAAYPSCLEMADQRRVSRSCPKPSDAPVAIVVAEGLCRGNIADVASAAAAAVVEDSSSSPGHIEDMQCVS